MQSFKKLTYKSRCRVECAGQYSQQRCPDQTVGERDDLSETYASQQSFIDPFEQITADYYYVTFPTQAN